MRSSCYLCRMALNIEAYQTINGECLKKKATLVAVSKTKPAEDILELYNTGHRDFGENYVQELAAKYEQLPKDIRWHFIGHLQSNKVKYIAPFVHLIHGVDSEKLLFEINKPSPVPLSDFVANLENNFGYISGCIPVPVSFTVT